MRDNARAMANKITKPVEETQTRIPVLALGDVDGVKQIPAFTSFADASIDVPAVVEDTLEVARWNNKGKVKRYAK